MTFGLFGCVLRGFHIFCLSFAFLYLRPIMRSSFGSSSSGGLHRGGRPAEGSESEWVGGGSGGSPVVVVRAPSVGHPPLSGKGKGRIS